MSGLNPRAVYFPGENHVRPWAAEVAGQLLLGRSAQLRKFKTAEAAQQAADLDAFLREDGNAGASS